MEGKLPRAALLLGLTLLWPATPASARGSFSSLTPLFVESFEDAGLAARGWYDNTTAAITTAEHIPAPSTAAIEFRFPVGATTPAVGGGLRRKFPPTDRVYLSYWVKYSAGWTGSDRPYHPHEFNFLTDADSDWVGPAFTHLTTYIEQNEGRPLLAIQDGSNIDQARIGVDLTALTELRSVAGCNGDSDGYGPGDCYRNGSLYWNGKDWRAAVPWFEDAPGPRNKNDWHFIEAYFQLNSIRAGRAVADGRVAYWYDGVNVIDAPGAVLRTGQHAAMRFAQLLVAPYIGDGSPVDQTMWVDELTVAVPAVSLLRNDSVAALSTAAAARASIFTGSGTGPGAVSLDEFGPDRNAQAGEGALESAPGSSDDDDFYAGDFASGSLDPDPVAIVTDATRPLVFWQVTVPANTLRLVRAAGGRVGIDY